MNDAAPYDQALKAIFATEARGQLGQIEVGLAALGKGRDDEVFGAILDALHTLAGAARSVELLDFEWLCRALERLFTAARNSGVVPAPLESIAGALALAPQLIGQPAGRTRNRALALCCWLDALAAQLAQQSVIS